MSDYQTGDIEVLLTQLIDGQDILQKDIESIDPKQQKALLVINQIQQKFLNIRQDNFSTAEVNSGMKWGHLLIQKKIAAGGMGDIYSGFEASLNRQVAIKFLNKKTSSFISSRQFIAEAQRMAQVRHPHVLAVYGAQSVDGITGFWAELLQGEELSLLAQSNLPAKIILQYAKQLASAVNAIHENSIIHADIKPNNVIIEPNRGAVLMDFGAGNDTSNQTSSATQHMHTPMVMAPELFLGKTISYATDVYALGILFYFISNQGKYPHQAKTFVDLRQQVLNTQNIETSGLTGQKQWQQLIKKMLSYQPKNRPNIQQVLAQIALIQEAPIKKLKLVATYSALSFLLVITAVSLFSYFRIKNAKAITDAALQETTDFNHLMYNFLSSTSPSQQGKDVLLVEVLNQLISDTRNNSKISNKVKAKTIGTVAVSQFNLGQKETGLALIKEATQLANSDPELQVGILLKHANLIASDANLPLNDKINQINLLLEKAEPFIKKHQLNNHDNLANLFTIKGKLASYKVENDTAKSHFQDALNHWSQTDQDKNSEIQQANIYLDLANIASNTGQLQEALKYNKQALSLFDKHSKGTFNSNVLAATNNLAIIYSELGEQMLALETFKNLQQISLNMYGANHSKYLINTINLIVAYNENKLFAEAMKMIEENEPSFRNNSNEKSAVFLYFISAKADVLKGLNRMDEAIQQYQTNLLQMAEHLGENNDLYLINAYHLADCYLHNDQIRKAQQLLIKNLATAEATLTEKHLITLEIKEALAWTYHLSDEKPEQVEKMLNEVLAIKLELLGQAHESSLQIKEKISQLNLNH